MTKYEARNEIIQLAKALCTIRTEIRESVYKVVPADKTKSRKISRRIADLLRVIEEYDAAQPHDDDHDARAEAEFYDTSKYF